MYNLLIAGGAAVAAYGLGVAVVGEWVAGLIPAALALIATYFVLARRTGKQLTAIFEQAMAALQAGKLEDARRLMNSAMPLGKWQVLVTGQIEGQLGALDYLEGAGLGAQRQVAASKARFASAKEHLARSWSRDWRSRTLLACVHHRENEPDAALKVLEAVSSTAAKEPIFWGVWAYLLNEARRRDEALQVVGRGLKANEKSAPLLAVQEAMSNRKRPDFKGFGEAWYQFFPEQVPQEVLMEQARAAQKRQVDRRMTVPAPRR
jgi:predicted Zn-dependent protease